MMLFGQTQEAYTIFLRSGLEKPILSRIWRMSDVGSDNKLNKVGQAAYCIIRANQSAVQIV